MTRDLTMETTPCCTTYKTHTMATCHGGTGCPLDRVLDILTEDPEHTHINNNSTHSSDATVAQEAQKQ